ncbi:MAG: hypothetical protein AAF741_13935 [Bacteroidota bacterium]
MALINYLDGVPVSQDELKKKVFASSVDLLTNSERISFRNGNANLGRPERAVSLSHRGQFTPIGIGKPLSVEYIGGYSGEVQGWRPKRKKTLLISSKVKSTTTYGSAQRMLNLLKYDVKQNETLSTSANDVGGSIIYYSPSVTLGTIDLNFELAINQFEQGFINDVSNLFNSASQIPIFAPAAPFLFGMGGILKLAGKMANSLFEKGAFLSGDYKFDFDRPRGDKTFNYPGIKAIFDNARHAKALTGYSPGYEAGDSEQLNPCLIDRQSGKKYTGPIPYLLIEVDGRKRSRLKDFEPRAATAAQLEMFYGDDGKGRLSNILDDMIDAMKIYSDLKYYNDAMENYEDMQNASSPEEKEEYKLLFKSNQANVINKVFAQALKKLN